MPPEQAPVLAVEALGIDLDGTLVDSAPDLAWAANTMLAGLGLPTHGEPAIRAMIGDGIDRLVERCLRASLDAAPDDGLAAEGLASMIGVYRDNLFVRSKIYPGVHEALQRWHGEGRLLACITNKRSSLALPLLQQAGLAGYFNAVYCADTREERKPSPVLLQRFLRRWAIPAARFVMIGDSSHDILAARAIGSAGIAVSYGYGNAEALAAASPTITIDRLDLVAIGTPAQRPGERSC